MTKPDKNQYRDNAALLAVMEAVSAVHGEVDDGTDDGFSYCSHDGDGYPCETMRAMQAALKVGA